MSSCMFKVMARGLSSSTNTAINNVTVIGGGLVGSGIAQVSAQIGQNVVLVDKDQNVLNKSKYIVERSLERVARAQLKKKGEDPSKNVSFINDYVNKVSNNITYTYDIIKSVKSADLVLEVVVENLKLKQDVFLQLDHLSPKHTILATTTSSLSVGEIGEKVKRKDKYGGLHFFNPVAMMKLLEVVKTEEMSAESYDALLSWGQAIGKTCITCKDTPGFVVNRLLAPLQAEAFRMLERGVASARDIDTAMKLGAGHPMGPFELADLMGLDTAKYILDGWNQKYPEDEFFKPIEIVNELVSQGKYGQKTGEGFYKYVW